MKNLFCVIVMNVIIFLFYTNAYSFMAVLSTNQLVRVAEVIVDGNVTHVVSYWNDDGTVILSRADVVVDDVLKGVSPGTLQVEYPGGIVGDLGMRETGAPSFTEGEKVILFLKKKGKAPAATKKGLPQGDVYHVVAGAQGHYTVKADGFAYKGGLTAPQATKALVATKVRYTALLNMIMEILSEE